jgi:solute carrier family 13 (sodium-dependent dicarboxylate transporter), member 2/3/5
MTSAEKWSLGLFIAATIFAFTRQFYSAALPGLSPSFSFLVFALLCFLVRSKGQRLLTWEYTQSQLMWGLFYVFAGGTALGNILSKTGTAKYIADLLVPYAGRGGLAAIVVFSVLTIVVAQVISNVATVAITVPVAISVFTSVGVNPIPYVYIIIAASHCGFMLPSSAGSSAIAAGYGVNLKTMFVKGFWAAVIALIVIIVVSYLSLVLWPGFGVA